MLSCVPSSFIILILKNNYEPVEQIRTTDELHYVLNTKEFVVRIVLYIEYQGSCSETRQ